MKYYKRESYLQKIRGFYDEAEIIKVITGVRRCGKSSLMQTIADEISEKGIAAENIISLKWWIDYKTDRPLYWVWNVSFEFQWVSRNEKVL